MWAKFERDNPKGYDGSIILLISGDRGLTGLNQFRPYARNFIILNFFHTRLRSLVGLEHFVNLTTLNDNRTEIGDPELVHIARLSQIRRLEINGNMITNLAPLAGMNYEFLGLACLQIRSLAPLLNMISLQILDLYQNPLLKEVEALSSLIKLRDLDIRQTTINLQWVRQILPNLTTLVHD